MAKILVFGIGNQGRKDDGLGPRLVERLKKSREPIPNSSNSERQADEPMGNPVCVPTLEFRYQLNVEDAFVIKDYDAVVFADAAAAGDEGATLSEIGPSDAIAFTTHRMSPASVLALCHELFGGAPKAYVLAIRGYDWDIGEGLSPQAEKNLDQALNIFHAFLSDFG